MHRPPEVGYLQFAVEAEQQVLRLDVAVDHLLAVAVEQRVCQLEDVLQQAAGTHTPPALPALTRRRLY